MVFGRAGEAGRDPRLDVKGRATVELGDDGPIVVQTYFTPNPRKPGGYAGEGHLAALRRAAEVTHPSPVVRLPPPPVRVDPAPWASVDLDDMEAGDRFLLDLDGTDHVVEFVAAVEDDDQVEVEYVRDGRPGLAYLPGDEPVRRLPTR